MALTACGAKTDGQGMELARHGTALFPVGCYQDDLSKDEVPWHWHTELEAIVVVDGRAVIAAGAERFTVGAGDGFFINSGVLHAGWADGRQSCRLHSLVFQPRLVGGSRDSIFWQGHVQPLLSEGAPKAVLLRGAEAWQGEALGAIEAAWQSCTGESPGYEFRVREGLSQLVFLLARHCITAAEPLSRKALREESRVKQMLQFIQAHYDAELDTAQIAKSAMVSESECLRCFRSTIGTPPIQYLKQFRIQKAAELLRAVPESVAEVGARCGFQDASYFAKTFRELKGCTPTEYRQAAEQRDA